MRVLTGVIVAWLIIGAIAAGQRHYYSGKAENCASVGRTMATIFAGPLNYLGINPNVSCKLPQPSK